MKTAAVICRVCNGTGKDPHHDQACSRCKGFGQVIAYVTATGHEITDPEILAAFKAKK